MEIIRSVADSTDSLKNDDLTMYSGHTESLCYSQALHFEQENLTNYNPSIIVNVHEKVIMI